MNGSVHSVTEFIQSIVSVSGIADAPIELPPVVGRAFAASIARLIHADFPHAVIEIADQHHASFKGLAGALAISDLVGVEVRQAIISSRPGACLLQRLGSGNALSAGGVQ